MKYVLMVVLIASFATCQAEEKPEATAKGSDALKTDAEKLKSLKFQNYKLEMQVEILKQQLAEIEKAFEPQSKVIQMCKELAIKKVNEARLEKQLREYETEDIERERRR